MFVTLKVFKLIGPSNDGQVGVPTCYRKKNECPSGGRGLEVLSAAAVMTLSVHEPLNQRTHHTDNCVLALIVGMMTHYSISKISRYGSSKVIAKTRGQIEQGIQKL
jgi:hypothetical protein